MTVLLPVLIFVLVLVFWVVIFRYAPTFPRFSFMAGIFLISIGAFYASLYFAGPRTGESAIGAGIALIFGAFLFISGVLFVVGTKRANAPTVKKTTMLVWVVAIVLLIFGMAQCTLS